MKKLGIFGSTGSIGISALDVVRHNSDRFKVGCLTARDNIELLYKQALEFKPDIICIGNEKLYGDLQALTSHLGIEVLAGEQGLLEAARSPHFDTMLGAIVGYAGLFPTIEAIKSGKSIALANKETLVVAGEIVTSLLKKHRISLVPIDSEHSALFQCMVGEKPETVRRIVLTASGGPFLHTPAKDFDRITPESALKHPNWSMGAKITIDSATMMNKGLEVIEAHWLFNLPSSSIDVAVHPQSIIHSMVEFFDGSTKAQMGVPDMKIPIQYALGYPDRLPNGFDVFDFRKFNRLDFLEPDVTRFPCLRLAYDAMTAMGTMPAVLNAANEIAVSRFLNGDIGFSDIHRLICHAMEIHDSSPNPGIEEIVEADQWARNISSKYRLN